MSPTFAQLGVPAEIVYALKERGIIEPFEIQSATIKDALAGRDVCGRAPTGSGKTLAFGIPLVATVKRAKPKKPRALVLAPTRELADQIHTELKTFAGDIRIGVIYGGVGYGPQLKDLRNGVDILVACPGRLEDLIEQGNVSLFNVDHVVLDEADRMADMGFMPAVRRILDQTAEDRQTVLFSATLDGDIAKLTAEYQNDPVRHEVGEETPDITSADHLFWKVEREERIDTIAQAVDAAWPAIIFTRTRHGADRLTKQLGQRGVNAVAIHGGRSQKQRTRSLAEFSDFRVQALVATDVAARGIHVDGVASVFHYDPPEDHKAYVHRSGRTARAGEGGVVISMLMGSQAKAARKMQREVGLEEPVTGADIDTLREIAPKTDRTPKPVRRIERTERKVSRSSRSKHSSSDGRYSTSKPKSRSQSRSRDDRDSRDNRGPKRDDRDYRGNDSRNSDSRSSQSRNGNSRSSQSRNSDSRNGDSRDSRSRDSRDYRSKDSRNGDSRDGRGSRSSDSRAKSGRSYSAKPKNRSNSGGSSGAGKKPSGNNGNNGGPNRKERRAHLQASNAN